MTHKYKCSLLPFERIDCLSIQDAQQKAGWQISAFDLPKLWEKTQGKDVIIAVLDTGCDLDHPDLVDNLLPGRNFVSPGKDPQDDNGHGSHVTGILVAENNDVGIVGVCPQAKVIPIKVLDNSGNGNMLNVADGIRYAVERKADFISMSLGTPMKIQQVCKAIQYAQSQGVVTFCAAGNAGETQEIYYPANYKETVSIGAVDKDSHRAPFSCTGRNLDFLAPGVDILSTVPKHWYAVLSGTSMAAPFACGVAALYLSHCKGDGHELPKSSEDYRNVFKQNTTQVQNGNYKDPQFYEGFGIIDPRKFAQAMGWK